MTIYGWGDELTVERLPFWLGALAVIGIVLLVWLIAVIATILFEKRRKKENDRR